MKEGGLEDSQKSEKRVFPPPEEGDGRRFLRPWAAVLGSFSEEDGFAPDPRIRPRPKWFLGKRPLEECRGDVEWSTGPCPPPGIELCGRAGPSHTGRIAAREANALAVRCRETMEAKRKRKI